MAPSNPNASLVDTVPSLVNATPPARHVDTPPTTDGLFWLHWLVAVACALTTLAILTFDKTGGFDATYGTLLALTALLSIPAYALCSVYHPQHGALEGTAHLTLGWCVLLACLLGIAFATKTTHAYSREVLAQWAVLGLAAQTASYLVLQRWAKGRVAHRQRTIRAAIIGNGPLALELAQRLRTSAGETLAGIIAPAAAEHPPPATLATLGSIGDLADILATQRIQRLYVALPHDADIKQLYLQLLDANVDVVWVPDLHGLLLLNHGVTEIGGLAAIKLNESPLTAYPNAARLKAVMDRSLALLGLIALSPLLLLVAVLVKLSSPGPVLFRQQRHGWNGQVIEVWKFRSMRMHDDAQVRQATRNDSRITPIGRFIRRTSIDELPQLFNVLQGSMSLVGPRPHAVAHNDFYANKIQAYMARHRIKPGITGLAQISGYRGETDTLDKMQKRVELDLAYINNWSLWLDIKILIKTPFTLFGKHIY
ncbi:sugar transferase [Thauera sp. 27]|uniref:undecaprenyl-phosphate glucose phosphotransferase n=1 Tax=Thauera sp. 27 TaxID=305700 RepID=UPI0002CEB5C4|nr:undecaprenyl-phosphate glucose phosphotransferase [Thauera sp. 27]ENO82293.1 sugar transferase [Thauera sp. 27]